MRLFHDWRDLPEDARGATVALGNFDGVHLGHAAVVRAAHAARPDAPLAVLTFEPHPREVFRPDDPPFRLTLSAERADALAALGVAVIYELPFTLAFSRMSPEGFIREVLHEGLGARHLACGQDFAFGHRKGGDASVLAAGAEALGIGLTLVPPVSDAEGPLSSTRIRRALKGGYTERAARDLGRPWTIRGVVAHGDARGRTIGFPTANIALGRHIEPARGVYAVRVRHAGREHAARGRQSRAPAHGQRRTGEPAGGKYLRLQEDIYGAELTVGLLALFAPRDQVPRARCA